MTRSASITRRLDEIEQSAARAWNLLDRARNNMTVASAADLPAAFRALDLCLTHAVYLEAIAEYLGQRGGSRGSTLVLDSSGMSFHDGLGDDWLHRPVDPDSAASRQILEITVNDELEVHRLWAEPRPIPDSEPWFEAVWRDYMDDRVVR